LSSSNPTSGTFAVSSAQARALNLTGASGAIDAYVSLSSAVPFEFNQFASAGKYDAIGILQHEFTEAMGRVGSVGTAFGSGVYTALDLFRYSSTTTGGAPTSPTLDTSAAATNAFFSTNAGTTDLGNFNLNGSGADLADWNISMANDPFGYGIAGVTQLMSGNDVVVMAAIGWNMTSQGVTAAQAAAAYNVA
jgi:hypothetical protein